ncbi:MAG TPA: DUF2169 domain-containing protein, partial [Polyangium sp.]|nr:DUF2169 domain-containing protein [Polyangium sp.]
MDVVSVCPFRVASLLWQRQRGGSVLTIICKATFDLFPTQARLAQDQDDPNEDDNHWNDDPARSLYSPNDLVPFKVRADVLLVGYAFAPRGEQVRAIQTRLVVGAVDKAIEAYGERAFATDGSLREGARVTKVPLRYERAAGGPDSYNPVGIRPDAPYDAHGLTPLPNLQPPGLLIKTRGEVIPAIGYGPIAPSWPGRVERLGIHASTFALRNLRSQPLPEEIDPSFFNCAPPDQQLDDLRDNERIVLENLHPQQPRLITSLPGLHPRVFAVKTGSAAQEVAVRCDTLWIDTDRQQCTVVWRGQMVLERPNQTGRVVVAMEEANQRLAWNDVERHFAGLGAEAPQAAPQQAPPPPPPKPSRPATLPFPRGTDNAVDSSKSPSSSGGALAQVPTSVIRPSSMGLPAVGLPAAPGLPFVQQNAGAAPAPAPASAPSAELPAPGDAAPKWLSTTRSGMPATPPPPPNIPNATPFAQAPSPMPSTPPPSMPSMAIPAAPPPPPPMPVTPPPMVPSASNPGSPLDSPWANSSPRATGDNLPAVGLSGSSPISVSATAMASVGLGAAAAAVAFSSGSAAAPPPPGMVANAAGAGVAAASNAAAISTQWSSGTSDREVSSSPAPAVRTTFSSSRSSRDIIDLLWFDPETIPKLREHPKWKPILDKLRPPPRDLDFDDEPPPEDPPEVRDKRDVFAVITKGDSIDSEGIQEAIADAVADDGTFTPPLVLVQGELSFPFDELETLKATVTAVTPLIAGDKKLKETVDTVNELLKTPWLQSSSGVAEGLTARVKEAFAQGNRMLPPSYLDT